MKLRTAVFAGVTGLMLNLGLGDAAFAQSQYRDRDRSRYDRSDRERRVEQIVRQAYRDILRREPDRSGLRQYTNAMLRDDWSERDVRRSLERSDEYRRKFGRSGRRGR